MRNNLESRERGLTHMNIENLLHKIVKKNEADFAAPLENYFAGVTPTSKLIASDLEAGVLEKSETTLVAWATMLIAAIELLELVTIDKVGMFQRAMLMPLFCRDGMAGEDFAALSEAEQQKILVNLGSHFASTLLIMKFLSNKSLITINPALSALCAQLISKGSVIQ